MNKVRAFTSAYPGSMSEREDGDYLRRDDPASLLAALLERDHEQTRRIEDLEAALSQKPQRVDAPPLPQLTDAQIDAIWNGMGSFSPNDHRYFAREIVKAAYGVIPSAEPQGESRG